MALSKISDERFEYVIPKYQPIEIADEGDCVSVMGQLTKIETDPNGMSVSLTLQDDYQTHLVKLYLILYNKVAEYVVIGETLLVCGVVQKTEDNSTSIIALEVDSLYRYLAKKQSDPFMCLIAQEFHIENEPNAIRRAITLRKLSKLSSK